MMREPEARPAAPPAGQARRGLWARGGKRAFDLVVATLVLLVMAPVILLLAIAVKLDSKGPALYRAPRIGYRGRPFAMYKLRTMRVDADRVGGTSTAETDPRITRMGKHLRRFKLDELPQLLNVARGNMSLVGPRPEVEEYTRLYTAEEQEILEVLPGMTDLASIEFSNLNAILAKTQDPDAYYRDVIRPKKNLLRLQYARSVSPSLDLSIIARTAYALTLGRLRRGA